MWTLALYLTVSFYVWIRCDRMGESWPVQAFSSAFWFLVVLYDLATGASDADDDTPDDPTGVA